MFVVAKTGSCSTKDRTELNPCDDAPSRVSSQTWKLKGAGSIYSNSDTTPPPSFFSFEYSRPLSHTITDPLINPTNLCPSWTSPTYCQYSARLATRCASSIRPMRSHN